MATKKTSKKPTFDSKKLIIIIVSAVLLIAFGIGLYNVIDWALIDTPYDFVHMPGHIVIPTYIGAEISRSEMDEAFAEAKDSLLDQFTKKNPIKSGVIEEGMNVTVSITAKLDGATVKDVSYTSYEIADIGNHEASKDKEFFEKLEEWVLTKATKFDFNANSDWDNKVPNFKYTYPSDYSVTKVKGKEVTHEIVIISVTKTDAPAYNDELFTKNADAIKTFLGIEVEVSSVAEYEEYMMHQIEINTLWNKIVDGSTVLKYPSSRISKYEDEFDAYYDAVMKQEGLTRAQLLSQMGTTEDGYIQARTEYAQGIVKEELVLYEIIEAQNVRLTSEEYDEIALRLAKEGGYGDTVKAFEKSLGKEIAERTVIWEYVKDMLFEKANEVA